MNERQITICYRELIIVTPPPLPSLIFSLFECLVSQWAKGHTCTVQAAQSCCHKNTFCLLLVPVPSLSIRVTLLIGVWQSLHRTAQNNCLTIAPLKYSLCVSCTHLRVCVEFCVCRLVFFIRIKLYIYIYIIL